MFYLKSNNKKIKKTMSSKGGWKNGYNIGVLENNWNEERFDTKYLKEIKPVLNVKILILYFGYFTKRIRNLSKISISKTAVINRN